LPASCPRALGAIISKALAADIDRRYSGAKAFENDLTAYLEGKPTVAESNTDPQWDSNETIQKSPEPRRARKLSLPTSGFVREFRFVFSALAAGFLIGLFILVPALRAARFWSMSGPLRHQRHYSKQTVADISADWALYKKLERDSSVIGPISAVRGPFRSSLIAAGDEIIERYANSSDPAVAHFDWRKAQACLARALDLDPSDSAVKGKLALVSAYLVLARDTPDALEAKAGFEAAASLEPDSPDPHLGLARVSVYYLHNIGGAVAEFHQAERLGFKLGPREMEQEADGYLARAQTELMQAERVSKTSPVEEVRLLALARRDFDRANNLYEPIDGFSNVSLNLQNLYQGQSRQQALQQSYEMARLRRLRVRRWR
jgi:hypothetical protein